MNKMKKDLHLTALFFSALLILSITFFTNDRSVVIEGSNINHCDEAVKKPENDWRFDGDKEPLMDDFIHNGDSISVGNFYKKTKTTGVVVVKGEDLKYEFYKEPYQDNSNVAGHSAVRSLVSLFMGAAVDDGSINLNDYVTEYIPELENSSYESVTVLDLLQRSSGVHLTEECGNLFTAIPSLNESKILNNCFADAERIRPAGDLVDGVESESGVLAGYVLSRGTDEDLTSFVQDNFWNHLGAQHDSCWGFNDEGKEIPFSMFYATLVDYAKIGRLIIDGGKFQENKIVSSEWVKKITTPVDVEQINTEEYDYGMQWKLPEDRNEKETISIIGRHGFYIYLNFDEDIVIVKTGEDENYRENRDLHLSFFRATVNHFTD